METGTEGVYYENRPKKSVMPEEGAKEEEKSATSSVMVYSSVGTTSGKWSIWMKFSLDTRTPLEDKNKGNAQERPHDEKHLTY